MSALFALALARQAIRSRRFKAAFSRGRGDDAEERDEGVVVLARDGSTLRGRLLWALVLFVGVSVAGWVAGLLVARRLTSGDEGSDEFRLAAIMGGKEFHSHAEHLKSGTAITSLGGLALDLREATLDPSGASLELRTTMGGIEVRVPEYWIVEVDQDALGSELEIDVPSPEDLPEDAPKLRIHAVTRMGGGQITAKPN